MAVAEPPAREPQPPEPGRNPARERNMPASWLVGFVGFCDSFVAGIERAPNV